MPDSNLISMGSKSFEYLKKINEYGAEYWSAREIQPLLGYTQWRRFEDSIKRAITSCKQSGNGALYHFAGVGKMIDIGRIRKNSNKFFHICFCSAAGTLFLHFSAFDTFASENASWPVYDLVLKWVNFFIVIFLIVKFAGKPLMDFLRGRKEEKSSELRHLETEREKISVKIKEAMKTLDERKTRFARLKENITRQGESKKSEIISKAGEESIMIIEKAKRNAEIQLFKEKEKLRSDMTDQTLEIPLGEKHLK